MAKQLNHTCIVCGKPYHSCDSCEKIKSYSPWRTIADTFDHYRIYVAIKSFDSGILSLEEVLQELDSLGVTKTTYANWPEGTRRKLDGIFATSTFTEATEDFEEVSEQDSEVLTYEFAESEQDSEELPDEL